MLLFSRAMVGLSGRGTLAPRLKNSATSNSASGGTSFALTMPSAIVAGNFLVAIVAADGVSLNSSAITGWTELAENMTNGGASIYYKTAAGSDTATVGFGGATAGDVSALVVQFEGTTGTTGTPTSATASGDATPGSLTTTVAPALLVAFGGTQNTATIATPSGFDVAASYTAGNTGKLYVFTKLLTGTGATGGVLFDQSGSDRLAAGLLALKP